MKFNIKLALNFKRVYEIKYDVKKKWKYYSFRNRKKTGVPYVIDKPIFRIQSDTRARASLQLVDTSTLFSKGLFTGGQFFAEGGGDQFKRSKKIRVHPSGTGRSSARAHSLD